MGTRALHAPGQASGRTVDYRTDLFSLGVLLYEMATGRRPFQGRTSAELASAILRDTPRPLRERRAELPAALRAARRAVPGEGWSRPTGERSRGRRGSSTRSGGGLQSRAAADGGAPGAGPGFGALGNLPVSVDSFVARERRADRGGGRCSPTPGW